VKLPVPWTVGPQTTTEPLLVQVSRLELARFRDVPGFLVAALRIRRAAKRATGFFGMALMAEPFRRTFYTVSAWHDEAALRAFVGVDIHRSVMARYGPRMGATHFVTWEQAQPSELPPSWPEIAHRLTTSQQEEQQREENP